MTSKRTLVLSALRDGPLTVDEFVSKRGWYVNSWAPTFTYLKDEGLIERAGDVRITSHGGMAHVLRLTDDGVRELAQLEAVA